LIYSFANDSIAGAKSFGIAERLQRNQGKDNFFLSKDLCTANLKLKLTMTPLWQLSASQLRAAIAAKQISARDAVNASFERIDHHNDRLKAFITLCRARAETEAWQMDEALAQGKPPGLLQGIPFSAKDLTTTADLRTTYGSLIYQTHIPQYDELCVQRLRRAGAILIGKTNTPEFGMGTHTNNALCGPTANPYNMDYSSGGSSGGAAVAVAMGMGALAQGTDMGGSVRTPASFCGVVGLRPSAGRVPRRQKPLLWDYLDTDGVLARTVEDAALMLSVIAGHDAHDPISLAQPQWQRPDLSSQTCEALYGKIRLAFSADLGIAIIDKEVNAAFQTAIAQITPLCQDAIETHPDCSMSRPAFETIRAALLLHKQRHHYEKDRHLLSKTV
jgi:amidase